MLEWIMEYLPYIGGTIVTLIGLGWVPVTRTILLKCIKVLFSEVFLKKLFFELADKYVKSTKTTLDDTFLTELKKAFK